ncbi:MAG TPA: hypothetical protein VGH11_00750 [Jatrophihabitans sp.]
MKGSRPAALADRHTEMVLGGVLFVFASWLIWDAYEGRGRPRPFLARFLP